MCVVPSIFFFYGILYKENYKERLENNENNTTKVIVLFFLKIK